MLQVLKLLKLLALALWYKLLKRIYLAVRSPDEKRLAQTWADYREIHAEILQRVRDQGKCIEAARNDARKRREIKHIKELQTVQYEVALRMKKLRKEIKRKGYYYILENGS